MHPPSRLSFLLPAQVTPLVDRTDELASITRRLVGGDTRLLTLTGPAGVGKTRLAIEAVATIANPTSEAFPDGVVWVDLTPIRDPQDVLWTIARAIGFTDTGFPPVVERLPAYLQKRAVLLVLDNFEQVLPAAALLADLLASCPGLVLLVTSRVPLQLRWEQTLRVAPLPVPDLQAALPPLDALEQIPSVALFVERARARRAGLVLREKDAQLVAELVAQLDGLPLALELAAARLDVLSLPTLARRLEDRLRLLASEAPDRPARQRSLEAAVGWSYDLLSDDERRLFRCLGVFTGQVSLDAIAAVVSGVNTIGVVGEEAGGEEVREAEHTLQWLLSLAEKSLVLPLPGRQPGAADDGEGAQEVEDADDEDPEPVFRMLETVREYAQERLAGAGELAAARRAHASYYLALAEQADPQLRGADQRTWFLRLEREHANLRAALGWLLDQDNLGEREAGLRLAGALGKFWLRRGYNTECRRWLERALAPAPAGEGGDPAVRTRALISLGLDLTLQGDVKRERAVLGEAVSLAEQQQDPVTTAESHTVLGLCAVFAGEVAEGTRQLWEAHRRWETLGDLGGLGLSLFYLGLAADASGDVAGAAALYTDALQWLNAVGDEQLAGFVHCYLGVTEWKRGKLPQAVAQVQAGVEVSVAFRDRYLLSFGAQAAALVGYGAEPARQARLLGAADALAQATGATFAWERLPGGEHVVGPRMRREQGEWSAAYDEGRLLAFRDVASLALSLLEEVAQELNHSDTASVSAQPLKQPIQHISPFSAREHEVLRLVAKGLSSRAIGHQLYLAPSTVNYHLTSVFHKLGVDTRAQAVAVAVQRGLL